MEKSEKKEKKNTKRTKEGWKINLYELYRL